MTAMPLPDRERQRYREFLRSPSMRSGCSGTPSHIWLAGGASPHWQASLLQWSEAIRDSMALSSDIKFGSATEAASQPAPRQSNTKLLAAPSMLATIHTEPSTITPPKTQPRMASAVDSPIPVVTPFCPPTIADTPAVSKVVAAAAEAFRTTMSQVGETPQE